MADKIINDSNIASFLSKLATKLSSLFWKKADVVQIGIDSTPTENSTNLVTSGGVYNAVQSSSSATWGNITGTLSNQADLDAALSGKTDVVTGATNGNFAALDSNGNLTDSGHKHSDYLTSFTETDPVFSASAAAGILAADITAWNGKYTKPSSGIPEADLASAVTAKLNATEIFIAEFDETPLSDIYAAYQAGKYVVAKTEGDIFLAPFYITIASAMFYEVEDDGYCYLYEVTSEGWESVAEYHIPNDGVWEVWSGKYTKPSGGIPETDLAQAVREKLNSASVFVATYDETTNDEIWEAYSAGKTVIALYDGRPGRIFVCVDARQNFANFFTISDEFYATTISVSNDSWVDNGSAWCVYDEQIVAWNAKYTKPSGGIPKTDLASAVQTSLGKADTAYQKPSTGIPASDLASGVIPSTYAGSPSAGGPANKTLGIPFGYVDSTSTATVMTATVDNFPTILTAGVCAYIRNDVVASASGWTLNINGTGALPVYASNADASRVTTLFSAATTYLFVYNPTRVSGGCWDMYFGYNANDNTIGYMLRTNGAVPPTASKFYRYRLLFTSDDYQSLIPANTSSSTNATAARAVNQAKINPLAPIYYYSSTSAVEAGVSPGASYMWLQYSGIALGYSFNRTGAALTMTAKDPVFLKCAPQADGSAIMDAGTPIVQALPSTEDGNIYIYLGIAESATAITLYYWHPIYWYKDGAIRQWTNAAGGSSDEALSSSEIQDIWDDVMN